MEFTEKEHGVLKVILDKYKGHILDVYANDTPFMGKHLVGDLDSLLADMNIELEEYQAGNREVQDLNIGIIYSMRDVLAGFDIRDKNSPLLTTKVKLDAIISIHISKELN